MLTRLNYYEWSLLMKVKMEARFLWDAIKYDDVDFEQDRQAMEALCASAPPSPTSPPPSSPGRRSKLGALEWEGLTFRPDEQIEDFAVRLTNLMEQMVRNGDTDLDEARAVEKFIRCMPKRYEQLVFSIETLLDIQDLSIDNVAGRFKVVEDRECASESEQGKLLYSEQRRAGGRKGDNATTSKDGQERRRRPRGSRKNKPKGDRAGGAADPGDGRGDRGGDTGGEHRAGRDDTYHICNRAGHWARDCPQPRRNRGAAHVAEGDVDVGLFLTHGTVELDAERAAVHGLFLELDERCA